MRIACYHRAVTRTVTFTLPESLAAAAATEGLLTQEALERLLTAHVAIRNAERRAMEREGAMTDDAVVAEVKAARAEMRARRARSA